MESPDDVEFEALASDVMDMLPADRRAVARIVTDLVQSDPYRWPEAFGTFGEQVREARFECCRMR
ncbi:MAG: hypothetical protein JWR50_4394 [Mucilaginibacter sp.]|nr:hypothetical protein [Mucilaginibacter sp.]